MSTNQIQLNGKEILEKDFKTTMRGYNQDEVDEFLDIIINDYEKFQQQIEKLQLENERLKKRFDQPATRANQQNNQSNYDVLMRLSNLEKEVFGKKFADS
ncbi:MAG TPA: cell division regulator GpsB [Candidatus Dormibacteraeota bacterium]|nr:cell division regulator GpsB [Candidatus Dormibacteraeota bacterium]